MVYRRALARHINDIKVFFGILIYMGLHPEPSISDFWQQDPKKTLHPTRLYIGLARFEQIKRYLHIASPSQQPKHKQWWYKLEPLASSFD
jgi:hypothetical protein